MEQKAIGLRESNAKQITPVECSTPTVWWVREDQLNNAISNLINGQPIQSTNVDKVLQPVDFEKGTSQEGDFEKSDVLYIPIICWDGDRAVSLAAPDFDPFKEQNCPSIETRIRAFDWQGNTIPHKYSFIGEDGDVQEEELPADVVPYYESDSRFIRLSALFATPECDVEAEKEFPEVFNIFVPYILINFYLHGTPPNDLAGFPRAPFENFYSVDYGGRVKVEITNPAVGVAKVNGTDDTIPSTPFRIEGDIRIPSDPEKSTNVPMDEPLIITKDSNVSISSITFSDPAVLRVCQVPVADVNNGSVSERVELTFSEGQQQSQLLLCGFKEGISDIEITYTKPNMPKNKSSYKATFMRVYVFKNPVDELIDMMDYLTPFEIYLLNITNMSTISTNADDFDFKRKIAPTLEQQNPCKLDDFMKARDAWNRFKDIPKKSNIPPDFRKKILQRVKKDPRKFVANPGYIKRLITFYITKNYATYGFVPSLGRDKMEGKPRLEKNMLQSLVYWQTCKESGGGNFLAIGKDGELGLTQITRGAADLIQNNGYDGKDLTKAVPKDGSGRIIFIDDKDVCALFAGTFKMKSRNEWKNTLSKLKNDPRFDPLITIPLTVNIHRDHNRGSLIGQEIHEGFKTSFDPSDIILPYIEEDFNKVCKDENKDKKCDDVDVDLTNEDDKSGNSNARRRAIVQGEDDKKWDNFIVAKQILGGIYNAGADKFKIAILKRENKDFFDLNKLPNIIYAREAGYSDPTALEACRGWEK